jgi:formylglycine-generating enzyme required for sulfatase activity
LVNNGVEESPPLQYSTSFSNTVSSPKLHDIFINLEGTNVGFKHWHPVPVTQNGGRLSGQGEMGGVWEWTSTVLENYEGFKAMDLYLGYTGIFQVLFLEYA